MHVSRAIKLKHDQNFASPSKDQRAPNGGRALKGPLCMTKDQRAPSNDQRGLLSMPKDQRALTNNNQRKPA